MTIRAHFDGKVIVPDEPVDLPKDQELEVEVRTAPMPPLGSAARFLQAIRNSPPVSKEAVEELERSIAEGRMAVRFDGAFDEDR